MAYHDANATKLVLGCLLGGPLSLSWGLKRMNKKRLLENTPTSRIQSAAMGLVELMGIARQRKPLRSPLTDRDCCWWRCEVQELRSSGKNSYWATIKEIQSPELFYIEDATGRVLLDPFGAELHVQNSIFNLNASTRPMMSPVLESWGVNDLNWLGGTRSMRVCEQSISEMSPLFVLGELVNTDRHLDDRQARFRARLQAIKSDPEKMKAADTNQDGTVDAEEWDAFRLQQEEAFLKEELSRQAAMPNVEALLVKKPSEQPFIISVKGPDELERSMTWQAPLAMAGGIAVCGVGVWLALLQGWAPWVPLLILGGGFLLSGFIKLKGVKQWAWF